MFDPAQLPVPDLGLTCKGCDYPLASLLKHRCPECGRWFSLEEYVPEGLMPPLFADGEEVRATPEVVALLETYQVPFKEIRGPLENLYHPGVTGYGFRPIGVARDDYLFTIDLLRRQRRGEPMPARPAPLPTKPWVCDGCHEENPGNFGVCWNCESPRGGDG